jgi:hypothetical protein
MYTCDDDDIDMGRSIDSVPAESFWQPMTSLAVVKRRPEKHDNYFVPKVASI